MVFEQGYGNLEAAEALGVSRQNVGRWCRMFEEGGLPALELGPRGRRPGEQAALNGSQSKIIIRILTDKTPDQLKMPFVLWTAAAVKDLIGKRFGITLAVRTVRKYLQEWDFTPQKPIRKAWQQSSAAVKKWLEVDYPAIAKRAKSKGATIFWVDETGVCNQANSQRGYAPVGKTPVLKQNGTKRKVNMIGGVSTPSYSPELNADEYLNRDLKKNVNAKKTPGTVAEGKANIVSFMHSLQKLPGRVKKYFNGENIKYAANASI